MSIFQLKIELDTSLESSNKMTFTKNLLHVPNYKGKPLDMYPYFAPYSNYNRSAIENMTYPQRVEVFFNRKKFEQVVIQRLKTKTKQKTTKEIKNEDLKHDNFVFTMKMLFSCAFPSTNNFSQSIDYLINTGSFSFSNFMPSFSNANKHFSYLKINNEIYTVNKVIWINDVYNNPNYSELISLYNKFQEELDTNKAQLKKDIEEQKSDLKTVFNNTEKLNSIKVFLQENVGNTRSDYRSRENEKLNRINSNFNAKFNNLDTPDYDFNFIENTIPLFMEIKSLTIPNPIKVYINEVLGLNEKIRINELSFKYVDIYQFESFPNEDDNDQRKINENILKLFPIISKFSSKLSSFDKEKIIGNTNWIQLIKDWMKKKEIPEIIEKFKNLSNCYNEDSNCNKRHIIDLLSVELDQLKTKPADSTVDVLEVYLQVNVIEGEITKKNFSKIKCSYIDEELDPVSSETYDHSWDIKSNKYFYSLKDKIKQANEILEKESKTAKKTAKNLNVNKLKNKTTKNMN